MPNWGWGIGNNASGTGTDGTGTGTDRTGTGTAAYSLQWKQFSHVMLLGLSAMPEGEWTQMLGLS